MRMQAAATCVLTHDAPTALLVFKSGSVVRACRRQMPVVARCARKFVRGFFTIACIPNWITTTIQYIA